MIKVSRKNRGFQKFWYQDFERPPMRQPRYGVSVTFVADHLMNLLCKGHLFNVAFWLVTCLWWYTGKIVVAIDRKENLCELRRPIVSMRTPKMSTSLQSFISIPMIDECLRLLHDRDHFRGDGIAMHRLFLSFFVFSFYSWRFCFDFVS